MMTTLRVPDNIDSKFRFILIASERAKQLQNGARQRLETKSRKLTYIAMQEVANKLINFEVSREG
ncbi:MAG: DNA-directed RNA polymerase subunit omega [Acidobacteria bacterium]|nr:DNA-directed RNA polymerase subunit omega [Acidobacteriota bacterium]